MQDVFVLFHCRLFHVLWMTPRILRPVQGEHHDMFVMRTHAKCLFGNAIWERERSLESLPRKLRYKTSFFHGHSYVLHPIEILNWQRSRNLGFATSSADQSPWKWRRHQSGSCTLPKFYPPGGGLACFRRLPLFWQSRFMDQRSELVKQDRNVKY